MSASTPTSNQSPGSPNVHIISHPLVQHKLTLMRRRDTGTAEFRRLLSEISLLMAYELTRELATQQVSIETPLEPMLSPMIDGKKIVLVPILRAGAGILDGMLDVIPGARVGHLGLYRDHDTLQAIEYYCKLPQGMAEREVIVLDPMLATGNSAIAAISRIKQAGARSIRFVCIVSCPEGVAALSSQHPEVPIYTAAIDRCLNEKGYILPGLGDAGDRLYGTR
jgi:uracil phosphoribosyltransferase